MTYLLMFYLGGVIHGIGGMLCEHAHEQPIKWEEWPAVLIATVFWPFGVTAALAAAFERDSCDP